MELINLSHRKIDKQRLFKMISQSLKKHCLYSIDLSHNELYAEDILELSNTLITYKNVVHLKLSNNRIAESFNNCLDKFAISKIFHLLISNLSLTSLDISSNIFSDKVFFLFLQSLRQQNKIFHLNLSNIALDDYMLQSLKDMLSNSIKSLDLSYNNITNQGFVYFIANLSKNNSIVSLNIAGNKKISNDSLLALYYLFQDSKNIIELSLHDLALEINFDLIHKIEKLVTKNMKKISTIVDKALDYSRNLVINDIFYYKLFWEIKNNEVAVEYLYNIKNSEQNFKQIFDQLKYKVNL